MCRRCRRRRRQRCAEGFVVTRMDTHWSHTILPKYIEGCVQKVSPQARGRWLLAWSAWTASRLNMLLFNQLSSAMQCAINRAMAVRHVHTCACTHMRTCARSDMSFLGCLRAALRSWSAKLLMTWCKPCFARAQPYSSFCDGFRLPCFAGGRCAAGLRGAWSAL